MNYECKKDKDGNNIIHIRIAWMCQNGTMEQATTDDIDTAKDILSLLAGEISEEDLKP